MKILLQVTLLFLTFSIVAAQSAAEQPKGAILTFEKNEIDLGDIPEGIKKEFTVKFTNTGQDTLIITKVRAGCGCTAALVTTEVIQPSDSGEIKITFNTAGRKGMQHKDVTILSNDISNPRKRIVFIANVVEADKTAEMKKG